MRRRALIALSLLAALVLLDAQPPGARTVTLAPQIDVFQTSSAAYTLTKMPATNSMMVFLNGVLMLQGTDYTLAGNVVAFVGQSTATPRPAGGPPRVIQVMYWVLQPS